MSDFHHIFTTTTTTSPMPQIQSPFTFETKPLYEPTLYSPYGFGFQTQQSKQPYDFFTNYPSPEPHRSPYCFTTTETEPVISENSPLILRNNDNKNDDNNDNKNGINGPSLRQNNRKPSTTTVENKSKGERNKKASVNHAGVVKKNKAYCVSQPTPTMTALTTAMATPTTTTPTIITPTTTTPTMITLTTTTPTTKVMATTTPTMMMGRGSPVLNIQVQLQQPWQPQEQPREQTQKQQIEPHAVVDLCLVKAHSENHQVRKDYTGGYWGYTGESAKPYPAVAIAGGNADSNSGGIQPAQTVGIQKEKPDYSAGLRLYSPKEISYIPKEQPSNPKEMPYNPKETPYNPQMMPYNPKEMPYSPKETPYNPQVMPYSPKDIPYNPQVMTYSPQAMPYKPQAMPYNPKETPYNPYAMPHTPKEIPSIPKEPLYTPKETPHSPDAMPYNPKVIPSNPKAALGGLKEARSHSENHFIEKRSPPLHQPPSTLARKEPNAHSPSFNRGSPNDFLNTLNFAIDKPKETGTGTRSPPAYTTPQQPYTFKRPELAPKAANTNIFNFNLQAYGYHKAEKVTSPVTLTSGDDDDGLGGFWLYKNPVRSPNAMKEFEARQAARFFKETPLVNIGFKQAKEGKTPIIPPINAQSIVIKNK